MNEKCESLSLWLHLKFLYKEEKWLNAFFNTANSKNAKLRSYKIKKRVFIYIYILCIMMQAASVYHEICFFESNPSSRYVLLL